VIGVTVSRFFFSGRSCLHFSGRGSVGGAPVVVYLTRSAVRQTAGYRSGRGVRVLYSPGYLYGSLRFTTVALSFDLVFELPHIGYL